MDACLGLRSSTVAVSVVHFCCAYRGETDQINKNTASLDSEPESPVTSVVHISSCVVDSCGHIVLGCLKLAQRFILSEDLWLELMQRFGVLFIYFIAFVLTTHFIIFAILAFIPCVAFI